MQKRINKKAVGNVVATLSILLLTIVLVSIVSVTFNQILATPQLAPAMSCLQMQTSFPLQIQKACQNQITNQTEITLKRKLDTDMTEFDFFITTPTETSTWCCGAEECPDCDVQPEGQIKTYYLNQTLDTNQNNKVGILLDNCLIQTKNIGSC